MYNILFADDEPIVIQSLQFIIDNDFPNQFESFYAETGADAVKMCRVNKIDIAFIDINMPGISGLEAIKNIKQANPNLVVVILSAFDRFQYAQKAVELGVYKYLTKPVNRTTIAQTLRGAMSIVDAENDKIINNLDIREKLNAMAPIVVGDFIYTLIYPFEHNKNFSAYLKYFNITSTRYFFCIIELPSSENKLDTYATLQQIIAKQVECIVGPLMMDKVVVFFPLAADKDTECCHAIVRTLYRNLSLAISAHIKIGASDICDELEHSVKIYNHSLAALNAMHGDGFLFYENMRQSDEQKKIDNLYTHILARIKAGDMQGVSGLFASCMSLVKAQYDLPQIKNFLFVLIVLAREAAHNIDASFSSSIAFKDTFASFEAMTTCDILEQYALSCFADCVHVFKSAQKSQLPPTIEKSIAYINAHMSEDITLEKVAEHVDVHAVYLSRLFKETTGETFKDFITSLRIDKAKKLLAMSSKSIKEVTFDVGYNDQNYFSKLFKTYTGQTPTEYRTAERKNILQGEHAHEQTINNC